MSGNRVVHPGNIKRQARSIEESLKKAYSDLGRIESAITSFSSEKELAGKAWSAAKNHMKAYDAVVSGAKKVMYAVAVECHVLIGSVGSEVLREKDLLDDIYKQEKTISRLSRRKKHYYKMIESDPANSSYWNGRISDCNDGIQTADKIKRKLKEKIEKIDDIESATDGLFTSVDSLISCIKSGLSALEKSGNNGFKMPPDPAWMTKLYGEISDVQRELLKNAKGKSDLSTIFSDDPVNLSTGNFIYEKNDIEINGNTPLVFSRFYNSISEYSGSFGVGWIHSFDVRLEANKNNGKLHATLTREDGREESFATIGNGKFVATTPCIGILEGNGEGYIYITDDNTKQYFDKDGKYVRKVDNTGVETTLTYTGDNLKRISRKTGEYLEIEYDKNGYIARIKDHAYRTVDYRYKEGKLIATEYSYGGKVRYQYDDNGFLDKIINPANIVAVVNEFDKKGRVTKQEFPDGSSMSFEYDERKHITTQHERNESISRHFSDSRLRTVKNEYSDGEERFEYNNNNQRTRKIDKNGNETQLEYDSKGNLLKIINAEGSVTEISYDENNLPLETKVEGISKLKNEYTGSKLRSQCDGLGRKTVFFYGAQSEPKRIIYPDGSDLRFEYDDRGNMISQTDETGGVTKYEWDDLNRPVKSISPNGNITQISYDDRDSIREIITPDNVKHTFEYDASGRLLKEIVNGEIVEEYTYNRIGKIDAITDSLGRKTEYIYDEMRNISEIVLPNQGKIKYAYSGMNHLESVEDAEGGVVKFTYDGEGNMLTETDELGNVTEYAYSKVGEIVCIKHPDLYEEHFEYDAVGNLTKFTDRAGNDYTFEYDAADQLIRETDSIGNCREYSYTKAGYVETEKDEAGRVTAYEYYPGGSLKAVTYPDGTIERFEVDAEGNVTAHTDTNGYTRRYEYDCMDRIIRVEGDEGDITAFEYDYMGNMISKRDANGNTLYYEYDSVGNLIKAKDPFGNETEYDYDSLNELTEIRRYSEGRKEVQTTRYLRDIMGRLTGEIDPLGNMVSVKLDAKGQVIEKIDKDGLKTLTTYTSTGEISGITYDDGTVTGFEYDPLGRIRRIKDAQGITEVVNDRLGRVERVKYPDDKEVSYTYGISGEVKGITYPGGRTVHYGYDEMNRLSQIKDEDLIISHGYDQAGRLVSKRFSTGLKTTYGYTKSGMLSEMTHFDKDGVLDKYVYQYDTSGNPISVDKIRRDIPEDTGRYEYRYDQIDRLSEVIKDGKSVRAYSYDAFGNRKSLKHYDGREIAYSYNAANQLISEADSEFYKEYAYDKRGNLIEERIDGSRSKVYEYGVLNRLTKAEDVISGRKCEYLYNGAGHRVSEITDNGKIDYIVDFTREYSNLLQKTARGVSEDIIWDGINPAVIDRTDGSGVPLLYLSDHLGSPMRLVRANASVCESHGYDEFGNDLSFNPADSIQPFSFTGYRKDPISHAYFAQARQYMPHTGRFAGEDVIKGNIHDPETLNSYAYCYGSPLRYADMDGNAPTDYKYAYYLLDPSGAHGAGHAAVLLERENGTGTLYSFRATKNEIDNRGELRIVAGESYRSEIQIVKYSRAELVRFKLNGKPNDRRNINNEERYDFDNSSKYTNAIQILITNREGRAIEKKALSINGNKKQPYNLYGNNCTNKALDMLYAGNNRYSWASRGFGDKTNRYVTSPIVPRSIRTIINTFIFAENTIPNRVYDNGLAYAEINGFRHGDLECML